jgi:hypothetical protein
VIPERVRWLWPNRIPFGKLTILDGDPGLGKSVLALTLAAALSRGEALPCPELAAPPDSMPAANVLLISAEDGLADTISPRLLAARADLDRVFSVDRIPEGDALRMPVLPDDSTLIAGLIADHSARLMVIDPLTAFLSSDVNTFKDQDCRRALAPLSAAAEASGCAVVVVRHLNKARGANALYRGGGSIGLIGAARSGLLVARHPGAPDRRVVALTKSNLAAATSSLAYRLQMTPDGALALEWLGAVPYSATDLLSNDSEVMQDGRGQAAKEFLFQQLKNGPRSARELLAAARGAGVELRHLRAAKFALGILSQRQGGLGAAGYWTWALPPAPGPTPLYTAS